MYCEMKKGDVVFYEGDKGRKFYIIIGGEVEVLKEKIQEKAKK